MFGAGMRCMELATRVQLRWRGAKRKKGHDNANMTRYIGDVYLKRARIRPALRRASHGLASRLVRST
jgi:hypothetical protein